MPQCFATIGVRRASAGIVPRRIAAVADFDFRLAPRPKLHQRVHPKAQMIRADVCPQIAELLLADTPDHLEVVKVLFDRRPIGEGFQNLGDAGVGIGAEEGTVGRWLPGQSLRGSCRKPGGKWPESSCTA